MHPIKDAKSHHKSTASLLGHYVAGLRDNPFVRNVTVLAGGTAVGQILGIASTPIITRLYSPEDYGAMVVYTAMLGTLMFIPSLCYELAIPIARKEKNAAAVTLLSIALLPLTTCVIATITFAFSDQIVSWTQVDDLKRHLWLLPLGVFFAGLYQALSFWAVRKKQFKTIAKTKVGQSIAATVIKISCFPLGALGLILGSIVATAAGITSLFRITQKNSSIFRTISVRRLRRVAVRYRRFPQITTTSMLINSASVYAPLLIFSAVYGPSLAGQFGLVRTLAAYPMTFFGRAVYQVYTAEFTARHRACPSESYKLFRKTTNQLLVAAIPVTIALSLIGPMLFTTIFGGAWKLAGQFAFYLGPAIGCQVVVAPLSHTLNLLEKQSVMLAWDVGRIILVAISLTLPDIYGYSPQITVAAYSICTVLAYIALWSTTLYFVRECAKR